jgi:hypothetical protein
VIQVLAGHLQQLAFLTQFLLADWARISRVASASVSENCDESKAIRSAWPSEQFTYYVLSRASWPRGNGERQTAKRDAASETLLRQAFRQETGGIHSRFSIANKDAGGLHSVCLVLAIVLSRIWPMRG